MNTSKGAAIADEALVGTAAVHFAKLRLSILRPKRGNLAAARVLALGNMYQIHLPCLGMPPAVTDLQKKKKSSNEDTSTSTSTLVCHTDRYVTLIDTAYQQTLSR
jgi:hypothetical protein